MLRSVYKARPGTALVTDEQFGDLELAQGLSVRQWGNRGRAREEFRYLKLLRNKKSPHVSVLPPDAMALVDYRHKGVAALGIGAAHIRGGLSVSLPLCDDWQTAHVAVEREMLVEAEDGEGVPLTDTVEVEHASDTTHVETHSEWLTRAGTDSVHTGVDLWEARGDLFPNLSFLPRVEKDLGSLEHAWVQPVRERLTELQEAVAAWGPTETRTPAYKTRTTPESATRRNLCWCVDLDGEKRLFELHSRFTPGKGRLHFRLVPESSEARIAYIGPKLDRPIE